MKLNPKTAAKQFARITKKKHPKISQEQILNQPGMFNKWSTGRRTVILAYGKMVEAQIAYMNRITKRETVNMIGGETKEIISLVDNIQNKNKYTNGSLV